jgi:Major Facilitator Superfamily
VAPHTSSVPASSIIRRVLLGQLLFSAGHALTTGGFLNYFANPFFKGFVVAFAVLQVTPEAAESLAMVTRWLVLRWGDRKTVWWVSLVGARLAALAIPGLVYAGMEPGTTGAIPAIIGLLGAWYLLQGVSYTAYLSWLSDLVPEVQWGKMLGRRSMAISLVTVCMTYIAAAFMDRTQLWSATERLNAYVVLFGLGGVLCLASILPLVGLAGRRTLRVVGFALGGNAPVDCSSSGSPHSTLNPQRLPSLWASIGPPLRLAFIDPTFRWFLLGCWQLSFFQGLTQTAQYQFSANVLHVSQFDYYGMLSVMLLLQIPLAAIAGWLVDRGHDRIVMVGGLLALSSAMGCWWMATWHGPRWLMGAYVVWGLFGLVNVAQPSLGLKLAPRSDNLVQLSLFRQIGGLLAALAGMLGGLVLDGYSHNGGLPPLEVFRWLFIVSGVGRATAALWYWKATQPRLHNG